VESSIPLLPDQSEAPDFPDEALIEQMERIPEPAVLYLSGGRVAAMNSAAARLSDFKVVGESMVELVGRIASHRADGTRLLPVDLPFSRALRGEVVDQGERIDIALPRGRVYRAVVTSAPIIRDGKVVAALSVWHDFGRFVRDLAEGFLEYEKGTPVLRGG
jgi:PAS domain-containing protein